MLGIYIKLSPFSLSANFKREETNMKGIQVIALFLLPLLVSGQLLEEEVRISICSLKCIWLIFSILVRLELHKSCADLLCNSICPHSLSGFAWLKSWKTVPWKKYSQRFKVQSLCI